MVSGRGSGGDQASMTSGTELSREVKGESDFLLNQVETLEPEIFLFQWLL